MTTLSITNLAKTIQVFTLPRDTAPVLARHARSIDHADGTTETVMARVVHGDSLTLLAGETKSGLPAAYRRAPVIMKALAARTIKLVDDPAPAKAVVSSGIETRVDESPTEGAPTTSQRGAQSKGPKHSG